MLQSNGSHTQMLTAALVRQESVLKNALGAYRFLIELASLSSAGYQSSQYLLHELEWTRAWLSARTSPGVSSTESQSTGVTPESTPSESPSGSSLDG